MFELSHSFDTFLIIRLIIRFLSLFLTGIIILSNNNICRRKRLRRPVVVPRQGSSEMEEQYQFMFRPIPAPRRRLPPTPRAHIGGGASSENQAVLQNPGIGDYDKHRSPRMLPQIPTSDSKYHYESDYQQEYQQYYANQPVYYQPIQGN